MKSFLHLAICFLTSCMLLAADVSIQVDAASPIRTIPETMYGGNLTAWDGAQNGTNSTFNNLLKASGRKYLRCPGGSWGDAYLWSDMEGPNGTNAWIVSYPETLNLLSAIRQPGETLQPTLQPIVNFPGNWYGYTDPNGDYQYIEHGHQAAVDAAVAWVQDQSSRTPTAQYWEIGNEQGGFWEEGWFEGISGAYYGDYFADFYLGMKAVNPAIKIGACAEPYDRLGAGGQYDYAGHWDVEMLLAAQAKNVIPDFLIIHQYPGTGETASYNPTLLAARVNDIAAYTANMDTIISDTLGPEYVGQIRYWMTEWDCGAHDSYSRTKCYVNALFHAQYIMEMASHNWQGANAWAQSEYGAGYFVYPVWYVHPLLINRFGREMITVTDSHSLVRAYGAIDAAGSLTILAVNNSPTLDLTADINIVGFAAAAGGLRWLVQPAGSMVAGGVNIQDFDNLSINGTVHPDPLTVGTLAGQAVVSGNTMSVTLPKSSMLFLTIPWNPDVDPDSEPPSPDPMGWAVRPHVSRDGSIAMEAKAATDLNGVQYYFTCTSGGGHDSGWQSSPVYEDTALASGTAYTYTVKARDLAIERNETQASVPASASMISPVTATLNLANASFENGKTGWSFDPDGKFWTDSSQSTDGDWALHAGWYTGYTEINFFTNGVWQNLDYTIQSNELFLLKFDYWSENTWGAHEVYADIAYYNPGNSADTGLIATTKFETGGATFQWQTFTLKADGSTVPAAAGKKLRIRFRPMGYHWSYYKFDNVRLYQSAYNPVPAMWAHSVGADQNLSWASAETNWQSKGWTFDVYLSPNMADVLAMNTSARAASGLSQTYYDPAVLDSNSGYFWRVVANEPKSGGTVVRHPGPVWYFTSEYQWLYGDFTENGIVDFDDLGGFLLIWMDSECAAGSAYDLNADCVINLNEFSEMARNWQEP